MSMICVIPNREDMIVNFLRRPSEMTQTFHGIGTLETLEERCAAEKESFLKENLRTISEKEEGL